MKNNPNSEAASQAATASSIKKKPAFPALYRAVVADFLLAASPQSKLPIILATSDCAGITIAAGTGILADEPKCQLGFRFPDEGMKWERAVELGLFERITEETAVVIKASKDENARPAVYRHKDGTVILATGKAAGVTIASGAYADRYEQSRAGHVHSETDNVDFHWVNSPMCKRIEEDFTAVFTAEPTDEEYAAQQSASPVGDLDALLKALGLDTGGTSAKAPTDSYDSNCTTVELPEGFRFVKVGEVILPTDQYWTRGVGPWRQFDSPESNVVLTPDEKVVEWCVPTIRRIETADTAKS